MNQKQDYYLQGRGWISSLGYGSSGETPRFATIDTPFQYPPLETLIPELPARFGRFDVYTKVVFSAAVLALSDAGYLTPEVHQPMGIVIGSSSGVYDNDLAYYETTLEELGSFASPNLFSYTLPNVALGEIAVYYKLVGPTFCVGNHPAAPGREALATALTLLESGACDRVLAGWVEVAQKTPHSVSLPKGAAFAVISAVEPTGGARRCRRIDRGSHFFELFEGNQ